MRAKHKPKLGQNFLSDLNARQRIVDALGDVSQATVVEIGPGHGAITELLAGRAGRLLAIELDRALAGELRFRFRNQRNVEVVEADVLGVDLAGLVAAPAQIVGNLPYYITSDILLQLFRVSLAAPGVFGSAVVMMQREVAERVAAAPGGREFGLLSATAQMHAAAEVLFTLGPESFSPPPAVDSSVVRLRFRSRFAELGVEPAAFDRFLHQAFAQKRKTLAKNLRQAGFLAEQLMGAWPAGLEAQVRAEATSLEDLAALFRSLQAAS